MTIDYTLPTLGGGGLGAASYPADGGFNLPQQTLQLYGDLGISPGHRSPPYYMFGNIPGFNNAQPAPLSPTGIPMTPSAGLTPSQYAAPQSSGPYGLLALQMAGVQQNPNQVMPTAPTAPNVPIVPGTPSNKPPRGLLQS